MDMDARRCSALHMIHSITLSLQPDPISYTAVMLDAAISQKSSNVAWRVHCCHYRQLLPL